MRRAPGRWPDTSCPAPQLPGHRDVVLDRSKRWAGRFLARPTRRRMLLRNMAATCRANDPSRKNAVSVYMRRLGGPAGLRPAPAEAFRPGQQQQQRQQQQQQQRLVSCGMAGWVRLRGTLQVRPCKLGRALLVCVVLRTRQDPGWASCPARPRHASGPWRSRPRNRTHPTFDRFPLLLVGVDLGRHVDPCHAWMKSNR